jgi:hypothetical protein
MIKILYYSQTLEKHVEKQRQELKFTEHLLQHVDQLTIIENIVKITLYFAYYDGSYSLFLEYIGKAKTEIEAKEDIASIMLTFDVLFRDLAAFGGGRKEPEGRYKGDGKLENIPMEILLDVPWLPRGCEIEIEEIEEIDKYTKYTVACPAKDESND